MVPALPKGCRPGLRQRGAAALQQVYAGAGDDEPAPCMRSDPRMASLEAALAFAKSSQLQARFTATPNPLPPTHPLGGRQHRPITGYGLPAE